MAVSYTHLDVYKRQVHTIVPAAIGGRGIASDLVQHAFDYARAEGLRVAPLCSYAEVWLRRHPDYADLAT